MIQALNGEHELKRMGGLRRQLPLTTVTFVVGGAALAGLPFVTAGFWSKEQILTAAWQASPLLWIVGLVGVVLTSLYIFRLIFLAFFGPSRGQLEAARNGAIPAQDEVARRPGWAMKLPLVVLAVLSIIAGYLELPSTLGDVHLLGHFLEPVLPTMEWFCNWSVTA